MAILVLLAAVLSVRPSVAQQRAECALRIRVVDSALRPASTAVVVLEPLTGGKPIQVKAESGAASICDFDYGPHKLTVSASSGCPTAMISPLTNDWDFEQSITVALPPCEFRDGHSGGTACRAFVRVRDTSGTPVPGASVQVGDWVPAATADKFGRARVIVPLGRLETIVARSGQLHGSYRLSCSTVWETPEITIVAK